MDKLQLVYRLGLLFDRRVLSFYRNTYKGIVGQVQQQTLSDLYEFHSMRTQEIADRLAIPKQHASKILTRLVELGYVSAAADPEDGRSRLYSLTAGGRNLVEEHIEESNRHFQKLIDNLSEEEQDTLAEAMAEIVSLLEHME